MKHNESIKNLRLAREQFHALLEQRTSERDWQQFFTAHPYVLSQSLNLKLEATDIMPLGRPGRREPDFALFPQRDRPLPFYGLVEIKKPDTPILTVRRSGVAILSRDAQTAVEQLRFYSHPDHLREFLPFTPRQALFLGNQMHLFAIVGHSSQLERIGLDIYREMANGLLPDNMQLIPFDILLKQFEAALPSPSIILVLTVRDVPPKVEVATLVDRLTSREVDVARSAAEALQDSEWNPQTLSEEMIFLLAMDASHLLVQRLPELESFAYEHINTDRISYANHILEDLAYERAPYFLPDWAEDRTVRVLRNNGIKIPWYVG